MAGSILLLFGAATLQAPSAVWPEIQLLATKVLSLQALHQVLTQGLSTLATTATVPWASLLGGTHVVFLACSQPNLRQSFSEHVWPVMVRTVRKLLWTQVWVYVWKWVEAGPLWPTSSTSSSDQKAATSRTTPTTYFAWWQAVYTAGVRTLHKATPKLIKTFLRQQIDASLTILFQSGVRLVQEQAAGLSSLRTA